MTQAVSKGARRGAAIADTAAMRKRWSKENGRRVWGKVARSSTDENGGLLIVGGLCGIGTIGEVEDQTCIAQPRRAMNRRVMLVVSLGIGLLGSTDAGAGPARCHQVRAGETLAAIAPHYRTRGEELLRLNRTGRKAIMRAGSLLVLPPTLTHKPLFATPGRLGRESAAAQGDGLSRMRNDHMTSGFRRSGLLVAIPAETLTYYVAGVRPHLRVARPWVRVFVEHLAAAFHRSFAPAADHQPDPHHNHPAGAAADQSQRGPGRWGGAVDPPCRGRSRRVQARSRGCRDGMAENGPASPVATGSRLRSGGVRRTAFPHHGPTRVCRLHPTARFARPRERLLRPGCSGRPCPSFGPVQGRGGSRSGFDDGRVVPERTSR